MGSVVLRPGSVVNELLAESGECCEGLPSRCREELPKLLTSLHAFFDGLAGRGFLAAIRLWEKGGTLRLNWAGMTFVESLESSDSGISSSSLENAATFTG